MREVQVVGAAIVKDNKVLAAKRSINMLMPFKWEFAGGKVEKGESHEAALKRELMEELGVEICMGSFLAEGFQEQDDKKILLTVYEAQIIEGHPTPKEHSELLWIDLDRLWELDWADADIPACKALISRYGGAFC